MLVNAAPMLQSAVKGHYAVAAFNTNDLEWTRSILQAAEELQSLQSKLDAKNELLKLHEHHRSCCHAPRSRLL